METNGKQIKKLTAIYSAPGEEERTVQIVDVTDGKVAVRPTDFNPLRDAAIYYHGWQTDVRNIKNVSVLYVDGTRDFLGDPPVNNIAIQLVAESRTKVL